MAMWRFAVGSSADDTEALRFFLSSTHAALILVASDPSWFHQFSALMPASGHWLGRGAVRRRLGPRCPPPFPSVVRRAASLLRVSRGLCGFDPGFGVFI